MSTTNQFRLSSINDVAKKHNLTTDEVALILADAFKKVFLKEFPNNQIQVEINLRNGSINMWRYIKVVSDEFFYGEGDEDDETLIPLSQAQKISENALIKLKLNNYIRTKIDIDDFEKKSVRAILSIFNQLIIETVNKKISNKWIKYKNTVIYGKVEKIDQVKNGDMKGAVVILTNDDNETTQAYITKYEMIQTTDRFNNRIYETLNPGNTYLFYIKEVHEFSAGWPVNLTRTHFEIVKYLMKQNISEIADGTVEIKNIARIAGAKTKVLITSNDKTIDPIGACVGPRGQRLKAISNQILDEKIDIIEWDPDPIKTIVNAVIPGKVLGYSVVGEKDIILVTNEESYLAIIGKKGINIKLISMLSGWNIDVKTINQVRDERIKFEPVDDYATSGKTRVSDKIYQKHKINYQTFIKELTSDHENENYSKKIKNKQKNVIYSDELGDDFDDDNYLD